MCCLYQSMQQRLSYPTAMAAVSVLVCMGMRESMAGLE